MPCRDPDTELMTHLLGRADAAAETEHRVLTFDGDCWSLVEYRPTGMSRMRTLRVPGGEMIVPVEVTQPVVLAAGARLESVRGSMPAAQNRYGARIDPHAEQLRRARLIGAVHARPGSLPPEEPPTRVELPAAGQVGVAALLSERGVSSLDCDLAALQARYGNLVVRETRWVGFHHETARPWAETTWTLDLEPVADDLLGGAPSLVRPASQRYGVDPEWLFASPVFASVMHLDGVEPTLDDVALAEMASEILVRVRSQLDGVEVLPVPRVDDVAELLVAGLPDNLPVVAFGYASQSHGPVAPAVFAVDRLFGQGRLLGSGFIWGEAVAEALWALEGSPLPPD